MSDKKTTRRERYDVDNADEELLRTCQLKRQRVLNPIIDWDESDVWEFIREYNVTYCKLYDEGFHRLGCIGCPIATGEMRYKMFERWPKYKDAYRRAFVKMCEKQKSKTTYKPDTRRLWYEYWDDPDKFFETWSTRDGGLLTGRVYTGPDRSSGNE